MNNNTFEIFETVVIQRLQRLNKEQLDGACYFLFTLHERLPNHWKTDALLNELAIAELFDIISEMCTYIKTITQKYKSTAWLNGSLSIINIFRIHIKSMQRNYYTLNAFIMLLKQFINNTDELLETDTLTATDTA